MSRKALAATDPTDYEALIAGEQQIAQLEQELAQLEDEWLEVTDLLGE